MTTQEIFEKLMEYREEQFLGMDGDSDGLFNSTMWDIARLLGLSDDQAAQLAGDNNEAPAVTVTEIILNPAEYEITDGYVGRFGKTYKPATAETLVAAVAAAAQRSNQTEAAIKNMLVAGMAVEWCDSPNHYYDHGKGVIRYKRTPQPVQLVKCSCGHSVEKSQVMSASMGSSCSDCYDRMSA